jgi:cold shock CspA family protein
MEPILHQGRLRAWNDDRGFGFIASGDNGKDVFLHISAVKEASRRPQVGDTIAYLRVVGPNDKVRATKASIQGVRPRSTTISSGSQTHPVVRSSRRIRQAAYQSFSRSSGTARRAGSLFWGVGVLLAVTAIATSITSVADPGPTTSTPLVTAVSQPGCIIKGNISHNSGRKLYHVPGMEDYEGTIIDESFGERWFCTEQEAISNGWQRAPR